MTCHKEPGGSQPTRSTPHPQDKPATEGVSKKSGLSPQGSQGEDRNEGKEVTDRRGRNERRKPERKGL